MTRRLSPRAPGPLLAVLTLAFAGCTVAMSSQFDPETIPPGHTNVINHWPLVFTAHRFGWSCYSTYGCQVHYAGLYPGEWDDDHLRPSSASLGSRYPGEVLRGGAGPIPNFPKPAIVEWRAADGTRLKTEVDIGEIFSDQRVLHRVTQEEAGRTYNPLPEIILEVNDRTINVYMRTRVSTRSLQDPTNPHSAARIELIKASSKTY